MTGQHITSESEPFATKTTSLQENHKSEDKPEDGSSSICHRIPHIGFLLASLEGLLVSLTSVAIKMLKHYDSLLLTFYDFVGLSILSLLILLYREDNPFPKGYRFLLLGDALFSSVGAVTAFIAYKLLPIGDASVIVASTPIVILFLARIFLKEKIDLFRILLILVATVGLVFISQPTFLFGAAKEHLSIAGLAAAFASLFSYSYAIIFRRKLKDVHFCVITFVYTSLAALIICGVVVAEQSFEFPHSIEDGLYMFGIFFGHASCLFVDITALKFEQASIVSIGRLTDVVFSFTLQGIIFGEIPSICSIVGSGLVLGAIILMGVKKVFEERE